jgi:hypothetical protein
MVLSAEPEYTRSAAITTHHTHRECPSSVRTTAELDLFHTLIVESELPE